MQYPLTPLYKLPQAVHKKKEKRQGGGSTRCANFGLLLQYLFAFRSRFARGSFVTTRSTVINNSIAARSASAIISAAVRTHGTAEGRAGGAEDDAAAPGGGLWIGTDWPSEEAPKVFSAKVVPCSSGAYGARQDEIILV